LAGAFLALIVDGVRWLANGVFAPTTTGEFWFWLSPGGINLTQAIIERYALPALWDPVMLTILQLPIWAVGAALGFALYMLGNIGRRTLHAALR
jgi:hypothetical protein